MKKHNFSSGPAILPQSVFEQAAAATLDLNGIGLSILEISHRSPEFTAIIQEAQSLVRELLQIDETYEILFLTGGASSQFYMTAMNLLDPTRKAAFIDTGSWSVKAIKEAKHFGQIEVIASSKESGYTYIPKEYHIPTNANYLHLTSNNTIYGTQFHEWPETSLPMVCDMSSDIFSRPIDIKKFGLIYAGAQKNMGPAGTTLVIIRKDMLGQINRAIPTMLDYQVHIGRKSVFNTPPVFPIYVSMLTLKWLKEQGGVLPMEQKNAAKAQLLYGEIDRNPLFTGNVKEEDRSIMNVTFDLVEKSLEADFLEACEKAYISGIKGHRSVGGFRASMYNAMDISSVKHLVTVMQGFEQQFG